MRAQIPKFLFGSLEFRHLLKKGSLHELYYTPPLTPPPKGGEESSPPSVGGVPKARW